MQKLLMATTNQGKVKELKKMLEDLPYEILTLKDLNDVKEPIENGYTFKDNALIKASYYYHLFHIPTIADDSGISISYFLDLPGVHSARFLDHLDYPNKNQLILDIMKDVKNRKAYYSCVIAYVDDNHQMTFEGIMDGTIANSLEGDNGFGYDPIFIPKGYQKTVASLSEKEKNEISHRGIALRKLVNYFEEK